MKKYFLFCIAGLFCTLLKSQNQLKSNDSIHIHHWRIESGAGIGSINQFKDTRTNIDFELEYSGAVLSSFFGVPIDTNMIFEYEERVTPVFNLSVSRSVSNDFVVYTGCTYSEGSYSYKCINGIEYFENVSFFSLFTGIYLQVVSRAEIQLYSGINFAINISKRYGNNPYAFTNGKSYLISYQADFIKMEFGKRVKGTIALGYGVKGLLRGGIIYCL